MNEYNTKDKKIIELSQELDEERITMMLNVLKGLKKEKTFLQIHWSYSALSVEM